MPSSNSNTPAIGTPMAKAESLPNNRILFAILTIYAIAILYGVTNHEPWRDEAQAWLLSRDASITQLFKLIPSEGHPPLWYLLLMPFAKSGMPYMTQNWLVACIMITSVYLLLFKTQLPAVIKYILPFSYYFFFEYALIARNYCLIVFFTAAIISLYPRRFERPWLFAFCIVGLFNAHVMAFTLAFLFALLYIIDVIQYKKFQRKFIGSVLLMLVGGLYLIPYMALSPMASAFKSEIPDHGLQIMQTIQQGLLVSGNGTVAIILLLAMSLLLFIRLRSFMLLAGGIAGLLYIAGYCYNLVSLRHEGILFIILLAAYGIAPLYQDDRLNLIKINKPVERYGAWVLSIVMVWQMQFSSSKYIEDMNSSFSGAKDAASFIKDNDLQGSIIVGYQAWAASAVLPYLNRQKRFYYAECQRFGSYYINDSCFLKKMWAHPPEYAVDVTYKNFKDSLGNVLFLFNKPLKPNSAAYMDLLYHTDDTPTHQDEMFYIYRFKKTSKL